MKKKRIQLLEKSGITTFKINRIGVQEVHIDHPYIEACSHCYELGEIIECNSLTLVPYLSARRIKDKTDPTFCKTYGNA